MKFMALITLLAAGSMAFASGPYDQEIPPGTKIQYDSWCEGDRIMAEDRDGSVYAAWDCSELGEQARCVESALKKGEWTFVTATCR